MKPPYIVAELSANHNQSLELALQSIAKAKKIGVDAVKIQTYTPECLTLNSKKKHFKIKNGLWNGYYLYELYQKAYTPFEWHSKLFAYAKETGITLFSSPFSPQALELLESLDCPMYKIASFEITDLELIALVAQTHKPIILSSGIATQEEISEAIQTCYKWGNSDITLLKCTSAYPTPLEQANLACIKTFTQKWGIKVGLSDHTQGFLAAVIATTLGASMIEKHFILDHCIGGVDSEFSLDSQEFATMIEWIKKTSKALGDPLYTNPTKNPNRFFSRSLFIQKPIKKGEILTPQHLCIKRPNIGLPPKDYPKILGKRVNKDLEFGDALLKEDIDF